jgi:hypothetical protein
MALPLQARPWLARAAWLVVIAGSAALLGACGGGSSTPLPEAKAAAVETCPAGDATAQLQGMVDTAKGVLELPACVFNVSAPIVVSKPLRIVGASAGVDGTIIRTTAEEGVVIDPAMRIAVTLGPNKRGWWGSVENLRIEPAVNGAGQHALVIRIRAGFFVSTWMVDRVHLGDFGGAGLYLDNSAANTDGIFTGTVRRSFIENGIKGDRIGDSVTIEGNSITNGPSRFSGPGLVGVDISTVPGAAESTIKDNNITTGGGCVWIRNGTGIGVLNNWCETAGAPASGGGLIHLANCSECTVRDNRVQTLGGAAQFAVVIDGGQLNAIDSNKLTAGKTGHIAFVNGATQNRLLGLNRFTGGGDVLSGRIVGAETGLQ